MTKFSAILACLALSTAASSGAGAKEDWWFLGFGKDSAPLVMLLNPSPQASQGRIKSATIIYIFEGRGAGPRSGMKQQAQVNCENRSINIRSTQLLSSGAWAAPSDETLGYVRMREEDTPYEAIRFLCDGVGKDDLKLTQPPLEAAEMILGLLVYEKEPAPPTPERVSPRAVPDTNRTGPDSSKDQLARAESAKYQECVYAAAKRFASSKEEAPVVAQSAVQNCARLRSAFYNLYAEKRSYLETKAFFEVFDKHVLSEAQLIVVRDRSGKSR
jgi:hypothetical protein